MSSQWVQKAGMSICQIKKVLLEASLIISIARYVRYRPLTHFDPPLTHFDPPIISSIINEFALSERYVAFLYTNLQITAENSHYLMWLKSLCSWVKMRQSWVKIRKATVIAFSYKSQQALNPSEQMIKRIISLYEFVLRIYLFRSYQHFFSKLPVFRTNYGNYLLYSTHIHTASTSVESGFST